MSLGSFQAYPSLHIGSVAELRGSAFLIVSARGTKNFKGRKLEADGSFSTDLYNVPIMAVTNIREQSDAEKAKEKEALDVAVKLLVGSVVRFKSRNRFYPDVDKFVIIKMSSDGLTFSAVPLGGDPTGRYLRGVNASTVDLVPVD